MSFEMTSAVISKHLKIVKVSPLCDTFFASFGISFEIISIVLKYTANEKRKR